MPRCAIYARFSTDEQNPLSADDQVNHCRRHAEQRGWDVVASFKDEAISGSDNRRPGMTALLSAAATGSFDLVLAEDLDRITRDGEDSWAIWKRIKFAGAELMTISDGTVTELHLGLKGTMNAVELGKMASKIRRGQAAAVDRGRIPAGLCYGYDAVPLLRPDGRLERGIRHINPDQAAIVRRIYAEYSAGHSVKAIAHRLNQDGIPSARGGEWRTPSITGSRGRQIGILRNPIYVGRYVYGRVRMLRNPETRNRVSRVNELADRKVQPMPELAIVDEATWEAVQARIDAGADLPLPQRSTLRPRRLLSGLVRCGVCGGNYTVVTSERWGCSRHREAGTCDNGRRIGSAELQERVLQGLKLKLLSPEAVALLVREYHLEHARQVKKHARTREAVELRLRAIEGELARLVAAIAAGGAEFTEITDALRVRREERAQLQAELAEIDAGKLIALHPNIAEEYRRKISRLTWEIGADGQDEALATQIRALVDSVTLTPLSDGKLDINVLGSLEAVLNLTSNARPAPHKGAGRMLRVVAEDRYPTKHPARSFKA